MCLFSRAVNTGSVCLALMIKITEHTREQSHSQQSHEPDNREITAFEHIQLLLINRPHDQALRRQCLLSWNRNAELVVYLHEGRQEKAVPSECTHLLGHPGGRHGAWLACHSQPTATNWYRLSYSTHDALSRRTNQLLHNMLSFVVVARVLSFSISPSLVQLHRTYQTLEKM